MIKSSMDFHFNGHNSSELGIINVSVDDGLYDEPLFSSREIIEEKTRWNPKPYFNGVEEQCKRFELTFTFTDEVKMNKRALRNVMRWLGRNDRYSEMWFLDDCEINPKTMERDISRPKRIYFAMLEGESTVYHAGVEQGYITLTFKTNSPYCYSGIKGGDTYVLKADRDENVLDMSEEGANSFVFFFNHGDFPIKPEISFKNTIANQKIKIVGKKITNVPERPLNEFDSTYPIEETDYKKFPVFEISEGKKAKGSFELLDTVYDGETVTLGEKKYEFDLGDNLPKNKNDKKNILVPVESGKKAKNTLVFQEGNLIDGSTVTIGDMCFEYDSDDIVTPTNIKVDISDYVAHAKGILHLNSNLMPDQEIKVGDVNYTMIGGTNEFVIKMTDHLLTDGKDYNLTVRTDRKTLTQDNVNVNTKTPRNISKCLVRNVSKNPSDLGIRKMKYLNKDFVLCLWNGESNEDFQEELDGVGLSSRIIINFDRPVDEKTINDESITVKDIEGNYIPVYFDIGKADDGKTVGVTPKMPYEYDTDYILYISKAVKDKDGKGYNQVKKIKFHTKKKTDLEKSEYFENVSVVKNFVLYSGKQLDKTTVNSSNIYVKNNRGTLQDVDLFIINDGYAIDVVPKTRYEYDTEYTLVLTTKVRNIEGSSVVPVEKDIRFKTKSSTNEILIENNFDKIITGFPITGTITIPFDKKIDRMKLLDSSLIKMFDKDKREVEVLYEISKDDNRILKIIIMGKLEYSSTYTLYVSNAIKYDDGNNLETPLKYKIVTKSEYEDDNSNKGNGKEDVKDEEKSIATKNYEIVSIDKVFNINQDVPLDANTVNNQNIYVLNGKGEREDVDVQLDSTRTIIKVFPKPVWRKDEVYTIYGTDKVKTISKPRIFVGDSPVDAKGNKGDYANALEIFDQSKFEIIKTNGFRVENGKIHDLNKKEIKFSRFDTIFGGDYGLNKENFNPDGTVRDGTIIISIPNSIFTGAAVRKRGINRVETKKQMIEHRNSIMTESFVNRSVYDEKEEILKFATRNNNEHISVELDTSIVLSNVSLLINEVPKKIKNMRPKDDIYLYEEGKLDCIVDQDMLVPTNVPWEAKAYAGRSLVSSADNPDDYLNAKYLLEQDPNNKLGGSRYEVIDTTKMTLEEKKNIKFKEGDLVIGGELAGSMPSDFDAFGNLKTTPPQKDNPKDTRISRITGIPRDVSIAPARRLCGGAGNFGRLGTKEAIKDWCNLVEKARKNKGDLSEGYSTNIALNGITVKYKVPKGAKVYGTGEDFYNGLLFLNGFGYDFINVGKMTLQEKIAINFKKGDLILGGTGAKDVIMENGEKATVLGIPAIDTGEALRLGGINREETKKKIKDFAASLKVQSIGADDIVKIKIVIDDDTNIGNDIDEENSSEETKLIKENVRTEYHIVKSVKDLSRNRLYIEFYEDIRTIHYIKSIEIEGVYKFFDARKAEDYLFTAPYQIKIGYDKNETMVNIIKTINDTGTSGIEYSQRTFKHPIVLAQKLNDNEIELDAIKAGTKGNIPVSLVDLFDPNNRFITATLEGGKDCNQTNAIIALAKAIKEQNKLPERYNKDKYTCTYDDNTLTITHVLYGEKYNNIICLANVNKEETAPYIIHEGNTNLINMEDFLTRNKQMAKWDHPTLMEGRNPDVIACIIALKEKIIKNQGEEIEVDFHQSEDGEINRKKLIFKYKEIGEKGNINFDSTCVNSKISGKKFRGGLDGLEENEELYINCERQEIISSLGKDRYKNFNNGWLKVPLDGVKWKIEEGECQVLFRYRERYHI